MIENAPHKARFLYAISAYAGLRGKYFEKYVLCLLTKIVGGKVGRCDRADVVGSKVEMSRFCTPFAALSFE